MTEDDIKVNRIAFGVKTNKKDLWSLSYMNLNVLILGTIFRRKTVQLLLLNSNAIRWGKRS